MMIACTLVSLQVLAQAPKMKTTAWSLKVRNLDGEALCSIPQGTQVQPIAREQDGDLVQVETSLKNCKKGFVDVRYLRPVPNTEEMFEEAKVDEDGLSLRSSPKVGTDNFQCSLPKNTKLQILDSNKQDSVSGWVKVSFSQGSEIKGCPQEGWVSANYIRPTVDFSTLPVVKDSEGVHCTECAAARAKATPSGTAQAILNATVDGANQAPSPFINTLKQMRKTKKCLRQSSYACNRGLIQMPLVGKNAGFCGSHHYLPDSPRGVDAYASPVAACSLTAIAQKWKQSYCPNGGGCKLSWGDISHRTKPRYNGHVSHTDGNCVDIRPMRKGGFSDSGLTYKARDYDRQKTSDFIKLAKSMGASVMLFNDTKLGTRYASGHHNHIHVCFNDNAVAQKTCDNLVINPKICPELQ